jgi:hypothetical protein
MFYKNIVIVNLYQITKIPIFQGEYKMETKKEEIEKVQINVWITKKLRDLAKLENLNMTKFIEGCLEERYAPKGDLNHLKQKRVNLENSIKNSQMQLKTVEKEIAYLEININDHINDMEQKETEFVPEIPESIKNKMWRCIQRNKSYKMPSKSLDSVELQELCDKLCVNPAKLEITIQEMKKDTMNADNLNDWENVIIEYNKKWE